MKQKTNGLRQLIISGMSREKLIDFIKRKNSFYSGCSFNGHSDKQLRDIAKRIDVEKIKK